MGQTPLRLFYFRFQLVVARTPAGLTAAAQNARLHTSTASHAYAAHGVYASLLLVQV